MILVAKCTADAYERNITFKLSIKLALSSSLFNRLCDDEAAVFVSSSLRKSAAEEDEQLTTTSVKSNMYDRIHSS